MGEMEVVTDDDEATPPLLKFTSFGLFLVVVDAVAVSPQPAPLAAADDDSPPLVLPLALLVVLLLPPLPRRARI